MNETGNLTQRQGRRTNVVSYAAPTAKAPLEVFEFDAGPLGVEEVDVAVTHCGICHTDVGMVDNEWGISTYPCVAGHETVGTVAALGTNVDPRVCALASVSGWEPSAVRA